VEVFREWNDWRAGLVTRKDVWKEVRLSSWIFFIIHETDKPESGRLVGCLRAAYEDVVGAGSYAGLMIRVLVPPPDPEWAGKLVDVLRLRRVPSERADTPVLPSA
jgi:hypothetical protein